MLHRIIAVGLFLVFLTLLAFSYVPDFSEIDTDNDGLLSLSEAREAGITEQLFAKFDLDMDKNLSVNEYNHLAKDGRVNI